MQFFFYGTLLDPEVRALVLPHCPGARAPRAARLYGWARVPARLGSFPVVRKRLGGRVDGLLVEGIDRAGLWRLAPFEGAGYTVDRLGVVGEAGRQKAYVFLPERPGICLPGQWSLGEWQRRHKRRFLPRVRRWMGEPGACEASPDLSWHARRRIAALALETDAGSVEGTVRLAA